MEGRGPGRVEVGRNSRGECHENQERINDAAIICLITHGREDQRVPHASTRRGRRQAARGPENFLVRIKMLQNGRPQLSAPTVN